MRRRARLTRTLGAGLLLLALALGGWSAAKRAVNAGAGAERETPARQAFDDSGAPALPGDVEAEERPEVGYLAPDSALPDFAGRTVRLSDFRGKRAVFLNFWATWYPPCRAEMPAMERAYQAYRERGLEIPAVSVLMDRRGVIRVVEVGFRDWDSAGSRKRLETLLDGPPSRPDPGGAGRT